MQKVNRAFVHVLVFSFMVLFGIVLVIRFCVMRAYIQGTYKIKIKFSIKNYEVSLDENNNMNFNILRSVR